MNNLHEIIRTIQDWRHAGKSATLAILINASGSSPLPVGEMMAISSTMDMIGAVSRGCVEGAIMESAQIVMQSGQTKIEHFGYSDNAAFEVGLTCGGEIDVLITPVNQEKIGDTFLDPAAAACQKNNPFFLGVCVDEDSPGKKFLFTKKELFYSEVENKNEFWDAFQTLSNTLTKPATHMVKTSNAACTSVLIIPIFPAQRLIIVGAGEISIHLTKFAVLMGLQAIVIDPRSLFATRKRFLEADKIYAKWPQDCLEELELTSNDLLAVLSHDEKIDIPALQIGLEKDLQYIGLLGSKKTRQARFDILKEKGWQQEDVARIHAPIGIAIGSKKAEEIALSIMAEIIQFKNG